MEPQPRPEPKDPKWAESLRRFGEANERERRRRIRSRTLQERIELFEQLSRDGDELERQLEAQFGPFPPKRTHAVGLIRFWKHT